MRRFEGHRLLVQERKRKCSGCGEGSVRDHADGFAADKAAGVDEAFQFHITGGEAEATGTQL